MLGPAWAMFIVVPVVTLAVAEFLAKLREIGYEPPALLGVVGTAAMVFAAYHRGEAAIPVALVLIVIFSMLWYLAGAGGGQATLNIGVTLFGVTWIGVCGAFAAVLLGIQGGPGIGDAGKGILFGAILSTVAYDIGGYFVGRSVGSSQLSAASPNKTVEGLAGGCVIAFVIVVLLAAVVGLGPIEGFGDGAIVGLTVALFAPLGDLCESLVKRDLGVKDMGSVLPGHGGLLDRFDGLLFVLPAVWLLATLQDFFV
jgi:phosphatidate cytidylyltransferase